jgi:hypothetical protein
MKNKSSKIESSEVNPVGPTEVVKPEETREELLEQVEQLEEALVSLEVRLCQHKIKPTGRKDQILEVLKKGPVFIKDLSKLFSMTDRNVSCVVSYLRKDGHPVGKDSLGRLRLDDPAPKHEATEPTMLHEIAGRVITRKAV